MRRFGLATCALLMLGTSAGAHPHAWVTTRTTILFDGGKITGLKHVWSFDEPYTAMAVEGLDTNGDGIYDRQELQELAQTNIDGMEDLGYFTVAKLGENKLKFKVPVEFWLEHKDNALTLYFTALLEQPVTPDGFSFAIYDATFFVAFNPTKADAVTLGTGAPAGCEASTTLPEKDAAEIKQQGWIFPLGGPTFGLSVTAPGSVRCSKP